MSNKYLLDPISNSFKHWKLYKWKIICVICTPKESFQFSSSHADLISCDILIEISIITSLLIILFLLFRIVPSIFINIPFFFILLLYYFIILFIFYFSNNFQWKITFLWKINKSFNTYKRNKQRVMKNS